MDTKNDFQYEEENSMGTDLQFTARDLWVETYITVVKLEGEHNHKRAVECANGAVDAMVAKLKELS